MQLLFERKYQLALVGGGGSGLTRGLLGGRVPGVCVVGQLSLSHRRIMRAVPESCSLPSQERHNWRERFTREQRRRESPPRPLLCKSS
jgi:hypothetical protein